MFSRNAGTTIPEIITDNIPRMQHYFYTADEMQSHMSRELMDCRKLMLFLLLQTTIRGVASQDFAVKHSVHTSIFRSML